MKDSIEANLKKLAAVAADIYGMKQEELSVSVTYFPAEDTWGISIAEFLIEDDEYITNNDFLVEYIGDSVEQSFRVCFEELEKLKISLKEEDFKEAVEVVKDSKLLN